MKHQNINVSFTITHRIHFYFTLQANLRTGAKSRCFANSQIFRNFVGKKGKPCHFVTKRTNNINTHAVDTLATIVPPSTKVCPLFFY